MSDNKVIEMINITKVFPGIVANDKINLTLKKGEIHALLGENGAGKSTLMSVLFGLYQPEQGEIKKDGKKVHIHNPKDANHLGIGMVHQHFKLVDCFTVLENTILGLEPHKGGFIEKKEARKKVLELSKRYGLQVDPDALVEDITVGMQQRTEIIKMLYRDNEVLIFDEPTAVLTPQEIHELLEIMRQLAKEGKSILFISHKLNEIMAVADCCTVLRKGKYVGTVAIADTSKEELTAMMVGKKIDLEVKKKESEPGETVLCVKDVTIAGKHHKKNVLQNVSLNVKRGEIVGIAGIDGNGQSELVHALTGLEKVSSGTIELLGKDITKSTVRERWNRGMSCIPEDRHKHGVILDFSLEDNLILHQYFKPQFHQRGLMNKAAKHQYAKELIPEFDIRSSQGEKSIVRGMSGGNQQKAVIAREIDKDEALLIAVQPTRGLDVGAIKSIHERLVKQRGKGKAVLLVSFELDEVLGLSDRVLVMYEGEIVGELNPKDTSAEELGLYMAGAKRNVQRREDNDEQ